MYMCAFCSYQMKKQGVRLNMGIHTSLRRLFLRKGKASTTVTGGGNVGRTDFCLSGKQACSLQRTAPVGHTRQDTIHALHAKLAFIEHKPVSFDRRP